VNKILFSVNGDDSHTESNRKDTQKNIDKFLGSNKDILGISTVFSQNSPSFPESKESERKKIIYDALGLYKYNTYCTGAKEKIVVIKDDIDNKEMKLKYTKDGIEEAKEKIKGLQSKKAAWQSNKEERVRNILEEIDEIEQEDVESEVQELETKKELAEKYIRKCEKKISKLEDKKVEVDEGNYKTCKASLDELKHKIILTEREIEDIKETIDNSKDGTCPILNIYCDKLQDDTDAKKELEKELREWKTDERKLQGMKVEIEDTVETIEHSVIYNEEINEEIGSYKTGISSTEREIQYTETSIERLKYKEEDKQRRIQGCKDRIKEVNKETNPFIGVLKDEKKGIKDKEKEVTELGVVVDELYDNLKYYEFWKRGYGKAGIPNLKAEAFLESIEIETNNVLSKISDQLYVEIESQSLTKAGDVREKVGYRVHHPDKSVVDYWSYSGGQRQRIQIADKIAFNNLLGKFNFLFLDEVLEISLDDVGKENVFEGKWSEFFYGICHFSKLIFAVTPLDYEQATMINTIDVAPNSRVCSRSGSCLCFGCALNKFTRDDFCKEFIDMGAFTLGLPQNIGGEPLWFNEGKWRNFWHKFIIPNEGGIYKYNESK